MRVFPGTAGLALLLSGCADCTNEITSSEVSPDGARRVVAFHRQCGWLRGTSTHVSLVREGVDGLPEPRGNVLVVDEALEVSMEWVSPGHLAIRVPPTDQVEAQTSRFDNIRIVYQGK